MNENNNLNEKEDGVSLGEIFSWIWLKKIYLFVITAVFVVMVLVLVVFWFNPSKTKYVSTFTYKGIPYIEDGKYIDGSIFNYTDLISLENLEKIKAENPDYKDINVESMVNDGSFSINRTYVYAKENDPNSGIVETKYALTIPSSYFKDEKQARIFFADIISMPVTISNEMIAKLDYTANLNFYKSSKTYEVALEYLNAQVNLLLNGYDLLISEYGDVNVFISNLLPKEGMNAFGDIKQFSVSQLKTNLQNNLKEEDFYNLESELALNGYVKDKEHAEKIIGDRRSVLEYNKKTIDNKLTALNALLDKVVGGNAIINSEALTNLVNDISALEMQMIEIDRELKTLEEIEKNLADETSSKAFGLKLTNIENLLIEQTKYYSSVAKYLYERNMTVVYDESGIISADGGISIILVAVVGIVGGLVIGSIVSGILGHNSLKKKEESEVEVEQA